MLSVDNCVVKGKMSLADLTILTNIYVLFTDPKMNCAAELNRSSPTCMKIVNKLLDNNKIFDMIKDAKRLPFFIW